MKTYNITSKVSAQAKKELSRIIETHERYSKSYFFCPASSAHQRRSNERNFYKENKDVAFVKGNDTITVTMSYDETCNNVYYKLHVMINDSIKNIAAIKKLLK